MKKIHFLFALSFQIQKSVAKNLKTEESKVVILSAQEFRESNGNPYIEVLYSAFGSPFYTPSKLNFYLPRTIAELKGKYPSYPVSFRTLVYVSRKTHLKVYNNKFN